MSDVIKKDQWVLMHETTGQPVQEGDVVTDFRGGTAIIKGGRPPHKPSSTGFVWTASGREYYAGVFDLKWVQE